MKKQLLYLLTLAFLLSCAGDEFAANKSQNTYSVASALEYENKMCAQYSLIKPEVDILIMWDNSSSSFAMKKENLNAIKKLVSGITDHRFNFRILNVPMLGNSSPILLKSPDADDNGLNTFNYNDVITYKNPTTLNNAINSISFQVNGDRFEAGIDDSITIINSKYKNIFRKNANTFVMVVSNGDDQKCDSRYPNAECAPSELIEYVATQKNKMLCLRGNTSILDALTCSSTHGITNRLEAKMFRFISVIPRTQGCPGFSTRSTYAQMSKEMLLQAYEDESTRILIPSNNDAFDLCANSSNFADEILNSLESVISFHKYKYWPVAKTGQVIDKDSLRVYRNGVLLADNTNSSNTTSGYRRVNNLEDVSNLDTRIEPTVGEPFSGKFIELQGEEERNLLGSCLSVYYTDKKKYFGFIYLKAGKPSLDKMSVKMIINGQTHTIPQSEPLTNGTMTAGWQYIDPIQVGALANANPNLGIVDRPSNDSIIGHFIKLNGSYIIKDDQNVTFKVDYIPASNYGN